MNASATIKKYGLEKIFDYMYKDPERNLRKLLNFAEKHAGKMYPNQLKQFRDLVDNPDNSSITYKLKLTGGDIKSVQGDSGHAQAKMVTDQYSHILDENRKENA